MAPKFGLLAALLGTSLLSTSAFSGVEDVARIVEACGTSSKIGGFNTRNESGSDDEANALATAFCSHTDNTWKSAQSFGASLGLPIEDVPVKLGVTSDDNGWRQLRADLCTSSSSSSSTKRAFATEINTIDPGLVSAFGECTRGALDAYSSNYKADLSHEFDMAKLKADTSSRVGRLSVGIEYAKTPSDFYISLNFIPLDSRQRWPVISNIKALSHGRDLFSSLLCDRPIPKSGLKVDHNFDILCSRKLNSGFTIDVVSDVTVNRLTPMGLADIGPPPGVAVLNKDGVWWLKDQSRSGRRWNPSDPSYPKDPNDPIPPRDYETDWAGALNYCASKKFGGVGGWALPTAKQAADAPNDPNGHGPGNYWLSDEYGPETAAYLDASAHGIYRGAKVAYKNLGAWCVWQAPSIASD